MLLLQLELGETFDLCHRRQVCVGTGGYLCVIEFIHQEVVEVVESQMPAICSTPEYSHVVVDICRCFIKHAPEFC